MKFAELSEKEKISKIKEEFHNIVINVMNDSKRIKNHLKNEVDAQNLLQFLEGTIEKENDGCHCTNCADYNKYVQIPLEPALEPLVEVARNVVQDKDF